MIRANTSKAERRRAPWRNALLGAAAAGTLLAMTAANAADPIRIGLLLPKSGTYAVQGAQGQQGAMLAVQDFGGKVNGRPIQIIWYDENGPQTTQQNMRKLVEQDHVIGVTGGISSGDILAVMPIAQRSQTPLIATGPNATQITGAKCNRYTFRVELPNYTTTRTVYPSLAEDGKNWYFVSASYAWGIDGYKQMKGLLEAHGGKVLGADQTPLGTVDFSSYILKIVSKHPDVLFLGIGGGDLTNFLKQFHQMGLTGKILVSSLVANDTDLWAAGKDAATGVYPKIWNYTGDQNTAKSRAFVKAFRTKYGKPPESEAWQDYFGMSALLTAIKQTGSTDSEKIISFLENHKFDGYKKRPIYFRKWDHQLIQSTLVARVRESIPDRYNYFKIESVRPAADKPLESLYPDKSESKCRMGGS